MYGKSPLFIRNLLSVTFSSQSSVSNRLNITKGNSVNSGMIGDSYSVCVDRSDVKKRFPSWLTN
jgi:hypothetical protein